MLANRQDNPAPAARLKENEMTVYFHNKEPINLSAISLMGVSVKTNDSPIGFFGTGLKFAIATLLRTGHKIFLHVNGEHVSFDIQSEDIRGELFDVVCMNGEKLGFTTKLGRTWEPWQAYRELYCNCQDEDGVIGDKIPDGEWGTAFAVEGEAIEKCHRERSEIFILSDPMFPMPGCDIHAGSTRHAFYRGVRAHTHDAPAMFTYNVKSSLDLTEDRTVKKPSSLNQYISMSVLLIQDEGVLEQILLAERGWLESGLDLDQYGTPSPEFMNVVERLRINAHCNQSAIKTWERFANVKNVFPEADLDAYEEKHLSEAMPLLRRLDCDLERSGFQVVTGLGANIFGTVRDGKILISKQTFDMGPRFIASTLYEEWLHHKHQYKDESRELQGMLFEKLLGMVERVCSFEAA